MVWNEDVNQIHLALDRVQTRAFVSSVLNFRSDEKWRISWLAELVQAFQQNYTLRSLAFVRHINEINWI
jgi:hypothetical protein